MFLYRNILKQSLRILWNNKYLWFFGLFATFLGSSVNFELITRQTSGNLILNVKRYIETGILKGSVLANIGELFRSETGTMLILFGIVLLILALICFFIWLTIVSQAALVDASAKIISSKAKNKLKIKDGVKVGNNNFWPVFTLNIIVKIIAMLLFFTISLPVLFITTENTVSAGIIFIVLFLLLVPVVIILSFIIQYAICYKVIKKDNFINSIINGWRLFKGNWLISIEMAFLLFLINFLFGLALLFALLILSIPFLFLAFVVYNLLSATGFLFVITFGLILLIVIVLIGGAILSTFQIASWTGVYLTLVNNKGTSKIVRSIENLKNKQ